ncbi:MAG: nucleotidyltransferase, partial [Bacteroidales bacterium]|nr:nucleotidyltransferase [Bacteroidales bacterium]
KNTLSDNGEVNRGVCSITPDGYMADVTERFGIKYEDGCLVYKQDGEKVALSEDSFVSMNFWGFTPDFFQVAQPLFKEFMAKKGGEQKSEFLITEVVDAAVNCHGAKVKMLECNAKWFGITYKEDRPAVVERIKSLIASGEYPEKLWINS